MRTVLQVHLLVQLALADLLAALILMSTSVMNKIPFDNSIVICQYGLPLSLVSISLFDQAFTTANKSLTGLRFGGGVV